MSTCAMGKRPTREELEAENERIFRTLRQAAGDKRPGVEELQR